MANAYPDSIRPQDSVAGGLTAVIDALIVMTPDGKLHRIQGAESGAIQTSNVDGNAAAGDQLRYQRAIAYGIALICGMSLEDLLAAGDET